MLPCILVLLVSGPFVDLFGHKPLAVAGFITASFSMFFLVSAKSYAAALAACVLLGIGGQCVNVAGSTLMPITLFGGQNAPAAMNLGTTAFGLGAFVGPFLVGMLVKWIGFRATGTIIGVILLCPVPLAITAPFPVIANNFTLSRAVGLLTNSTIVVSCIAFSFGMGIQSSLGAWITTCGKALGFTDRNSSMILSSFWITIMLARLIAAAFIDLETGAMANIVLAFLLFLNLGLMALIRSKGAALVFPAAGLLIGPILPTIVGLALSKTDASLNGSVFGIIVATGYVGGSALPAAVGVLSKKEGIRQGLKITVGAALVILLLALWMGRF
jgi:fucose permease